MCPHCERLGYVENPLLFSESDLRVFSGYGVKINCSVCREQVDPADLLIQCRKVLHRPDKFKVKGVC